jgi:hypothetical protein
MRRFVVSVAFLIAGASLAEARDLEARQRAHHARDLRAWARANLQPKAIRHLELGTGKNRLYFGSYKVTTDRDQPVEVLFKDGAKVKLGHLRGPTITQVVGGLVDYQHGRVPLSFVDVVTSDDEFHRIFSNGLSLELTGPAGIQGRHGSRYLSPARTRELLDVTLPDHPFMGSR